MACSSHNNYFKMCSDFIEFNIQWLALSHNNYFKMCSDFIEFNIQWLALVTIIVFKCVQTLLSLIFNGLL